MSRRRLSQSQYNSINTDWRIITCVDMDVVLICYAVNSEAQTLKHVKKTEVNKQKSNTLNILTRTKNLEHKKC